MVRRCEPQGTSQHGADGGLSRQPPPDADEQLLVGDAVEGEEALQAVHQGDAVHLLQAEHADDVFQGPGRLGGAERDAGSVFHQQRAEGRVPADDLFQAGNGDIRISQGPADVQGDHRQAGQLLLAVHQLRDHLAVDRIIRLDCVQSDSPAFSSCGGSVATPRPNAHGRPGQSDDLLREGARHKALRVSPADHRHASVAGSGRCRRGAGGGIHLLAGRNSPPGYRCPA